MNTIYLIEYVWGFFFSVATDSDNFSCHGERGLQVTRYEGGGGLALDEKGSIGVRPLPEFPAP